VPELLRVLDFTPVAVPYLAPVRIAAGVDAYQPKLPDFQLLRVAGAARLQLAGDAIALCVAGAFALAGVSGGAAVSRGESSFISADERVVEITGNGVLFIAMSGTLS
jgi:mannose-6-phosphate isomerase